MNISTPVLKKLDPEIELAIKTICAKTFETMIEKKLVDLVKSTMSKFEKELNDGAQNWFNSRVEKIQDDVFKKAIQNYVSTFTGDIDKRMNLMDSRILDLKRQNSPMQHSEYISKLQKGLASLADDHLNLKNRYNKDFQDRFIQYHSNEEIYDLYLKSGLSFLEIAKKFTLEASSIHKWVHGHIQNVKSRHEFVLYLKSVIEENSKKMDQETKNV